MKLYISISSIFMIILVFTLLINEETIDWNNFEKSLLYYFSIIISINWLICYFIILLKQKANGTY
jgi:hypothetical protein